MELRSSAKEAPELLVLDSRNLHPELVAGRSSCFAFCHICRLRSFHKFQAVPGRFQEVVESMG